MGEIIRNITLFLLVAVAILIGVLFLMTDMNSADSGADEGLGSAPSVSTPL
jgi:hypothetical protein